MYRRSIVAILLLALVLIAIWMWLEMADSTDPASDAAARRAQERSQVDSMSRIGARPVDSAADPSRTWMAPRVDAGALAEALAQTRDPIDLAVYDYSAYADLIHWASGNADATPLGQRLLDCYVAERDEVDEPCMWAQRVVIERTSATAGEVVYVEALVDEVEPSCARLIECTNRAWRSASAPLPVGERELFALEFAAHPCFLGEGMSAAERAAAIEERATVVDEQLESLAACDVDGIRPRTRQACRYNARFEQRCGEHLNALRAREPSREP